LARKAGWSGIGWRVDRGVEIDSSPGRYGAFVPKW
jgi:hypothetical protein